MQECLLQVCVLCWLGQGQLFSFPLTTAHTTAVKLEPTLMSNCGLCRSPWIQQKRVCAGPCTPHSRVACVGAKHLRLVSVEQPAAQQPLLTTGDIIAGKEHSNTQHTLCSRNGSSKSMLLPCRCLLPTHSLWLLLLLLRPPESAQHRQNGLTAHLITPAKGAHFTMYLVQMKEDSKAAQLADKVERQVAVGGTATL